MVPWKSERLIFRGVREADEKFIFSLDEDYVIFHHGAPTLPAPVNQKAWKEGFWKMLHDCFLPTVICLPSDDPKEEPTPIGMILLFGNPPTMRQNRTASIGLSLVEQHRSKGYGAEAIKWCLEWAFQDAGLHRVEIGYFGWNERAGALYRRLGFVDEGRKREALYRDGRFWDEVFLSMLESEWRTKIGPKYTPSYDA